MRAFLMACVAAVIFAAGGYFSLNVFQKPTGVAYAAKGARAEPSWSWRVVSTEASRTACKPRQTWQWFFVDFRDPRGEPVICADSQ